MSFKFEVRETDLLGRIGRIRVGGRSLETPFMFPVIHPVNQAVSTRELRDMGFAGLMTNSYILYKRRAEEAKGGLHRLLGYEGMVMTDSGGYQALEYGDLDIDYRSIASFQVDIGSDLAVTLDRPTGYPQGRARAKETMEYSLKNALATLKEFGGGGTTWVGPIQGGLHPDLLKRSARSMTDGGFDFLALGSPVQVMENYMFADLVRMVSSVRKAIPYSMPLHLFGAGHTLTMALAVALGCDTFDSASYILFARTGRYMGKSGVVQVESMQYLPCSCRVCASNTVRDLLEMEEKERVRLLALHNLFALREELEACKEAIAEGRLWDLVQERSMRHPRLREAFKELLKEVDLLGPGTSALKTRGLLLRTEEDLRRPEVERAREGLLRAMRRDRPRASVVLDDFSAPRSKRVDGTDSYRVHPVFGVYPAELDFVYPFTQGVTAAGIGEKATIGDLKSRLRKSGYSQVRTVRGKRPDPRSKRTRRAASPSPRSSSSRPR